MAREAPLTDEGRLADQRRREKLDQLRWTECLEHVLATPLGRDFFYRVAFGFAGAMTSSFHNSGSMQSFREGRRDVGLTLIAEAQDRAPLLYALMLQEHLEEVARAARAAEPKEATRMENDQ